MAKNLTEEDHYNYDYYDTIDYRFKEEPATDKDDEELPLWLQLRDPPEPGEEPKKKKK